MEIARLILDFIRLLVWPIVIVVLMLRFKTSIENFVERLRRAQNLKIGVFGQSVELSGLLETAVHLGATTKADESDREGAIRQIAISLSQAAKSGEIGQLGGKRVLWVDDEPENNEHAIRALQAQGVEVITSRTTSDALTKAKASRFHAIVTDQLRIEDGMRNETAGYDLMRQLRDVGIKVPVILSTALPNRDEAHSLGFYDVTNTQHGVFELVMKAMPVK
jgi:CheY-like chemotaxis protein